jgi:hypothetical protein
MQLSGLVGTQSAEERRSVHAFDAQPDYGESFASIVSDLREYFDVCDNDHDGRIQYDGFLVLLTYLGARGNRECCGWFRKMDANNDGSIDIDEFIAGWME